jgi:hypothetical protein
MLATKINNNQWLYFVFALMKCSFAAFGEQNKNVVFTRCSETSMPIERG